MTRYDLSCSTNRPGNTGFNGSCFPDIKKLLGAFIVPVDLKVPAENLTGAGIIAYLRTLALQDNPSARVYPVHNFINAETTGGDRKVFTSGYGSILTTGENDYGFRFEYTAGGMQLQHALRSFNSNGAWAVIFYDSSNLYLLYNDDEDLTDSGLPTTTLWSEALTPPNGDDPTLYHLFIGMSTQYLNDYVHVLQYSGNPTSIKGLQNIDLGLLSWVEGTGVATVTLKVGQQNLYPLYNTDVTAASFKASNAATGGVITISTVAPIAGTQAFAVTLSTVDTDFPAGTQGINLDLVGPTELNTQDIAGYESTGALLLPTTV